MNDELIKNLNEKISSEPFHVNKNNETFEEKFD